MKAEVIDIQPQWRKWCREEENMKEENDGEKYLEKYEENDSQAA